MKASWDLIKRIIPDLPEDTVYYGAGCNMHALLKWYDAMRLPFNYDIWDINADKMAKINGHKISLPSFVDRKDDNPTMVVTIGAKSITTDVSKKFETLGWNVIIGVDDVWDSMKSDILQKQGGVPVKELIDSRQSEIEQRLNLSFIVHMCGGLGNQIFQYIFIRYLEESANIRVLVDDSSFFLGSETYRNSGTDKNAIGLHNGYELEYVFQQVVEPLLASRNTEHDEWNFMLSYALDDKYPMTGIARQLQKNSYQDLSIVIQEDYYPASRLSFPDITYSTQIFNPELLKIPGNAFFLGHWVDPGYFNAFKETLLKELTFRPIKDAINKQHARAIRESYAVGVHIRRGDFVKLGVEMPEAYYYHILSKLNTKLPGAKFFVFSDEVEWCKKNMGELGLPKDATVFIESNQDGKSKYLDMQLMAMCNVLVRTPASTFSLVACLLNREEGFHSINSINISRDDLAKMQKAREYVMYGDCIRGNLI